MIEEWRTIARAPDYRVSNLGRILERLMGVVRHVNSRCDHLGVRLGEVIRERDQMRAALVIAEAALADIGDADREPGDDLAWCEARAAKALPTVRAVLVANVAFTGPQGSGARRG